MNKKLKIKKGDKVQVLTGKDVNKNGIIEAIIPQSNKAIITGINAVKRTHKKSAKYPSGGIQTILAPVHISNLMVICPSCKKPTKVAIKRIDGKSVRLCKLCQQSLDKTKTS